MRIEIAADTAGKYLNGASTVQSDVQLLTRYVFFRWTWRNEVYAQILFSISRPDGLVSNCVWYKEKKKHKSWMNFGKRKLYR